MDIRDRAIALHNLQVAFYATKEAIGRQAEVMEELGNAIDKSDEAFAQLGLLAKQQKRQQPRKSYASPYAKFDKFRKKRK